MRMQLAIITVVSAVLSTAAFAQVQADRQGVQAGGTTQIKGNTEIKAKQENTTAVAVGEGNVAKNTAGAIKGSTQIKGNTKIKAEQKNTTAVAVGKGNKASNEAGVIGGN